MVRRVSTIEVRNPDLEVVESREMVELGMSLQLMESPSSVQDGCSLKSEYSRRGGVVVTKIEGPRCLGSRA